MKAKRKARLVALQIGLLGAVLCCVVVAVIVPWQLASKSGLTAVNGALETLIRRVTQHTVTDVAALFAAGPRLSKELSEELFGDRPLVNASDPRAVLMKLYDSGVRHFPEEGRIRYSCLALATGRMECIAFSDAGSQLQQVVVLNSSTGSLSNQLQWETDSRGWNSSWPENADDLGEYDPLEWVLDCEDMLDAEWDNEVYTEVTSEDFAELLLSLTTPIRDPDTGDFLGVFSADFLLDQVSEYLRSLQLSNSTRIAIVQSGGVVIGSSLESLPYTVDPSDGLPVPIHILDINDTLLASVAAALRPGEDASWFFPSSELRSHYRVDVAGKKSEELSIGILPLVDAESKLNLTVVIVVAESDFTRTLLAGSRVAFAVGICILVGVPLVLGAVVFGISRAIIKTSAKVRDEEENSEVLTTGLDSVLKTLQRLKTGDLDSRGTSNAIDGLIRLLASSSAREKLFQPDLSAEAKRGRLDQDQVEWLRSEVLGSRSPGRGVSLGARTLSVLNISGLSVGQMSAVGAAIGKWDCDVTDFDQDTVLVAVATEMLHAHSLLEEFELDMPKLVGFLNELQCTYQARNPYHNAVHAADVTQAVGWMIANIPDLMFSPLEKLAMLLSAAIHDAGHPGRNNQFMVATSSDLALLYNDASPLENFHLHKGFTLFNKHHILDGIPEEQRREFRKLVIALVLSTDMANHFQIVSEFGAARQHLDMGSEEQRRLLLKMIMKLADISNAARPHTAMLKWADRLFEEFLQQGDEERRLDLPVSSHMDRNVAQLPRLQRNFYKFIAVPLFSAFNDYRPLPELMEHLRANASFWQSKGTSTDDH